MCENVLIEEVEIRNPSFVQNGDGLDLESCKNAPFICLEPWYGVHDHYEYKGQFRDKYLMNHLQPGASFMSEYVIKIGE